MECANALAREVDDLSRRKPCWRVWAFDSTRSLLLRSCKPLSPFLPLPLAPFLSLSPLRFAFSLKEVHKRLASEATLIIFFHRLGTCLFDAVAPSTAPHAAYGGVLSGILPSSPSSPSPLEPFPATFQKND